MTSAASSHDPSARHLPLARLPMTGPVPVLIEPTAAELAGLIAEFDLIDLRKVRLSGELRPEGRRDWRLVAELGATAVQPCSVTLAPVTTRLDVPVLRSYRADYAPPTEAEAEMPEDDSEEPLPAVLDLMAVLAEALALALPEFPRAEGAELGAADFAEPGVAPMRDEDAKPFAGLAELKKRFEQ